jgi:hypothetical protein
MWTYSTATIRQSNAAAGTSLTTFCGLAEEAVDIVAQQNLQASTANVGGTTGIGVNSTTVNSSYNALNIASGAAQMSGVARHTLMPTLGINTINFTEEGTGNATTTWKGTVAGMLMTAKWLG